MVTRLLLALTLVASVSSSSSAHGVDATPSLDAWLAEDLPDDGAYPRRVAVVSELSDTAGAAPEFVELDRATFDKLGYFKMVDAASAAWDYKLNRAAFKGQSAAQALATLTDADTVVVAPTSGKWRVLQTSASGKPVTVTEAKGPKQRTEAGVVNWLPQALGWDGVVLASKEDFLLVGSTAAALRTPDIQALAVGDSAEKLSLRDKERVGTGLFALSDHKDGVGIFDVVLLGQGVKGVAPGTKLLIEKKKKGKKKSAP